MPYMKLIKWDLIDDQVEEIVFYSEYGFYKW